MKKDLSQNAIPLLAQIVIDSLKNLTSEGGELTPDALIKKIQSNKEIRAFLSDADSQAKQIGQLEKKSSQAKARKDKLLKQLQAVEDKSCKTEQFHKQVITTLISLLGGEEQSPLQASLRRFKNLLTEETDSERLSRALQELKEAAYQGSIEKAKAPPAKSDSFFGKLLKSAKEEKPGDPPPQTVIIKHLKTAYQDILDQLRLHLDEDSLERITQIGAQIRQGNRLEDFPDIRREILQLISEYINTVSSERELTAEFIREIGKRLIDLETYILESLSVSHDQDQANQEFNLLLEKQIGELKSSVDFSKTLAELKESVVSRLEIINQVLVSKQKKDAIHQSTIDKRVSVLQQHLSEMTQRISTVNEQSKQMEQELLRDPLTGASNRRAYDRNIETEMNRYKRYQRPFSLLLLDVDHFKKVNDTYGHAIGDKCLQEIIKRIQPTLRETDFLARYGGEEFIVILPETTGEIARETAERLRSVVENIAFLHKKDQVTITISIGVTEVTASDATHESIFQRTDQALYEAKRSGRNRVVLKMP